MMMLSAMRSFSLASRYPAGESAGAGAIRQGTNSSYRIRRGLYSHAAPRGSLLILMMIADAAEYRRANAYDSHL